MYYGMVTVAVILFGVQFFFTDRYQQENGTGLGATFTFSFLAAAVSALFMAAINGFRFGFTPFTLMMATVAAVNNLLCSLCSLRALQRCNLSLYSLFSMLGGMVIPTLLGILFYQEPITWGKLLCFVFVGAALPVSLTKSETKGGLIYCIAVFFFNGMSGALPKIFAAAQYAKATDAQYTILLQAAMLVISGIGMLCIRKKLRRPTWKSVVFSAGGGLLNCIANFLLLIALAVLPVSVQYPFLTGGVIIVSTVIAAFTHRKPSKKEVLAVILAFIGILLLVLVPKNI